ncbi:MAG: thiamine pyrophosphate-dependent enzyme [Candidatus Eisenbacteria bacterium]
MSSRCPAAPRRAVQEGEEMPSFADRLLQAEPWSGLIMGNHALARAMVEAGVMVATTYPGSPTPEIAAALDAVPEARRPYYFEISTNEKVALEVAAGASLNGHLATTFFKSVGLNVASDTLVQLGLMEMIGGIVVILGDDPGVNSSQNEQDNRHFARMSYIPMFEPATPQEAYEMFLAAARLSREQRRPLFVRMTTHVCHAKEVVRFGPRAAGEPDWTPRFDPANGPYIPITETVFPMKRRTLAKLNDFEEYANGSRFTESVSPNGAGPAGRRRGVIACGLPALAVLENLHASGAPVSLLKLGFTYPLPVRRIREFIAAHDEVWIVEELDRVMETEIKAIAWDAGARCRLLCREDPEEQMGEFTPDRTWRLLASHWPDAFAPAAGPGAVAEPAGARAEPGMIPRLPQLCPGCGHRSAFHAIRTTIPPGTITVADIGCHTMGYMPPYEMGQVLFCMGHATATASGLALRNPDRKVIAFMGDSTLFHAALPGIVNAVVRNHNVTLVVMENGTTAMTGHQPRPGSGEVGEKIPLPEMFAALGVKFVRDVDAYTQSKLAEHLREAMAYPGFAVIIAHHPCMLKFMREMRSKRPDTKVRQVVVDQETCDRSHVCVSEFGCPSFVFHDDGSVTVHEDLCIGDGSCQQTCPTAAIVRPRESKADAPGGGTA